MEALAGLGVAASIGGIVALAIQVVELASKVVSTFQTLQNAPQELQEFYNSTQRLRQNCEALDADLKDTDIAPTPNEVHDIHETLTLCKVLFDDHEIRQRKVGVLNGVLRTTWPLMNNEKLVRYKARIDRHYMEIIVPLWLRCIR